MSAELIHGYDTVERATDLRVLLVRIGVAVFGDGAKFSIHDVPAAVEAMVASHPAQWRKPLSKQLLKGDL